MRRRFCQSKSRFLRVSIAQDAARQPHSLCRGDHRIGDAAFIAVGAGLANLSRLRKGAAGRRRKSGQPQFFALRLLPYWLNDIVRRECTGKMRVNLDLYRGVINLESLGEFAR